MNTTTLRTVASRLLCCCALSLPALSADAQCSHDWQAMGSVPGVLGYADAMTEWDPDGPGPLASVLVVAGHFSAAGSRLISNVATWDGQAWGTVGNGLPGAITTEGFVTSLLVHDGELFASGGDFTSGTGPMGPVVRWTGQAWEPLGNLDPTGSAGPMIEFGGGIAAAVSTYEGGTWVPRVMWWDGSDWHSLGVFGGPAQAATIMALLDDNGTLLAGGSLTSVDGVAADGLVRWAGVWSDAGLAPGSVCTSAVHEAGEVFISAVTDGGRTHRLLRFESGSWTEVPGPANPPASGESLFEADGDVYVTENSLAPGLFRLAGSAWEPMGTDLQGVRDVVNYHGHVFACGDFVDADGLAAQGIASWDGASWRALSEGLAPLSQVWWVPVARVSGGQIFACGLYGNDQPGPALMRWTGQGWERLLNASSDRLEVHQGQFILSSEDDTAGLRRVNGSTVEAIGPANQGPCSPYVLDGVLYALPTHPWQSGAISRLDNNGWTVLGPALKDGPTAFNLVDGEVYESGASDVEGQMESICRWDGSSWVNVGHWPYPIKPFQINSVFRYNGLLYASGEFIDPNPVTYAFAVLINDQWQPWPSPYDAATGMVAGDQIVALASNPDADVVVAAYDGTSWRTLGTLGAYGLGGGPSDLQVCGDGLLVTGSFASINGQCSAMFARLPSIHCCGSADFNSDGSPGTDADIQAFFACLAGDCCATCGSADFNSDGDVATDADIEAFFRVLAGGSC